MLVTCVQLSAGDISKVTSWFRFRFAGHILKPGTLEMVALLHPALVEKEESDKDGVLGGAEVAATLIVFELVAPLGSLNVSVIVYVPFGKVIGKGVRRLEVAELKVVPLLVVKVQFTLVVDDILLPVEMKVNKTLEPAQTVN